jgi:starch-binding outer membrane protein, SusD/RagB family
MKLKNYIFATLSGACLLTSCTGFLDSYPVTQSVESDFYKTKKDAGLAVIGCYDALQNIWDGFAFPVASIIMSDECFGATGTGDARNYDLVDNFDATSDPSSINTYEGNWINCYKALYRCNMLLSKMDAINWQNDTTYRYQVESEARFIRAYVYFEMTRLWGKVPLITRPLSIDELNVPQSNTDDIYKLIAEDLNFASKHAYLKDQQWTKGWATSNDGRVTVYAAKSLLARVFLYYTGYFGKTTLPDGTTEADVIIQLTDVYNSGHSLVKPYKNLWPAACTVRSPGDTLGLKTTYAGEGNSEIVWAIKFNSSGNWTGNSDGFQAMKMMGMRSGTIKSFGTTCYGDGSWGGATVNAKFVADWDAYEPNDPRRTASVIDCDKEGVKLYDEAGNRHDQWEYTGYFNKKYTCLGNGSKNIYASQSLDFQINEYQDFTVIRYSDVLLMLTELTEDVKYLNEVRDRVGLTARSSYDVEQLRAERAHEFAFEGIRYWDLLRYDHTLDYAANAINLSAGQSKVQNGGGTALVDKIIDGQRVKNCSGLSQIPNTQIDLSNNVLVQNIGWE